MASSLPWMLIGVNLNRLDADGCPILERCTTNAFGSVQPKTTKSEALADLTRNRSNLHLQGRRLLIIATSSLRPILTDLGLSETFDSEMRVPPISNLKALERVLREVELFPSGDERRRALRMLEDAGLGSSQDQLSSKLQIGIKKLLSIIEMARQEPENVAERLAGALMGLGM